VSTGTCPRLHAKETAEISLRKWSMKKVLGICYIGRHVKSDDFILLRFAVEKFRGIHFLIGPVTSISNQQMKMDGLSAVINQLRTTPVLSPKELSAEQQVSDKELLKLKQKHSLASIELLEQDIEEIKMIPLHAGRGWRFDAHAEEVRTFSLPISNDEFMNHLTEALEMAS
jgi:hypothetical protein